MKLKRSANQCAHGDFSYFLILSWFFFLFFLLIHLPSVYAQETPCFEISARAKSGKVQLVWTHIEGTERYDVYRSDDSDPSHFVKIAETTSTYSTYLDDSVINEITYLYRVEAFSATASCLSSTISSHPTAVRSRTPINYAPVIYTTPVTGATVDIPYSYDVDATDPNGDTLTYALLISPPGMTIDSDTGIIAWAPDEAALVDVTVEVSDDTGGVDTQEFIIDVAAPEPEDLDGDGFTINEGDCDEADNQVFPGALELCYDLRDNDCDGSYDSDDSDCAAECGECVICGPQDPL